MQNGCPAAALKRSAQSQDGSFSEMRPNCLRLQVAHQQCIEKNPTI